MRHNSILAVLGCLVFVLLSRFPFLSAGFGSDDDAWRIALSAQQLAQTGEYKASRLPGYPIPEHLAALVIEGGPIAVNMLSVLMTLIATLAFTLILIRLRCREPYLAALAFAFTPVVYIASVSAMDYMWAMAFLLLTLLWLLYERVWLAGLALGLAVGCRLTSIFFMIPFVILIYNKNSIKSFVINFIILALVSGVVMLIAYSPVYARYGWGFLKYASAPEPLPIVIGQATVGVWGGLGVLVMGLLLLGRMGLALYGRTLSREQTALPESLSKTQTLCFWGASGLVILLYLRLPHESGYLIPLIPFVLIGLSAILTRSHFRWLCLALIMSPFVLGIPSPLLASFIKPSPAALSLSLRGSHLGTERRYWIDPLQGPLLMDYQKRVRMDNIMRKAVEYAGKLPPKSVILCEAFRSGVLYYNRGRYPESMFIENITERGIRQLLQSGYRVYALPGVRERMMRAQGFDVSKLGVLPLRVEAMNP
jgi:hypothetical protein